MFDRNKRLGEFTKEERKQRWHEIFKYISQREKKITSEYADLFSKCDIEEFSLENFIGKIHEVNLTFSGLEKIIDGAYIIPLNKLFEALKRKIDEMQAIYDDYGLALVANKLRGKPIEFEDGLLKWIGDLYKKMWAQDNKRRVKITEFEIAKEEYLNKENRLSLFLGMLSNSMNRFYTIISDEDEANKDLSKANEQYAEIERRISKAKDELKNLSDERELLNIFLAEIDEMTDCINENIRLFRMRRDLVQSYVNDCIQSQDIDLLLADNFPEQVITSVSACVDDSEELEKQLNAITDKFTMVKAFIRHWLDKQNKPDKSDIETETAKGRTGSEIEKKSDALPLQSFVQTEMFIDEGDEDSEMQVCPDIVIPCQAEIDNEYQNNVQNGNGHGKCFKLNKETKEKIIELFCGILYATASERGRGSPWYGRRTAGVLALFAIKCGLLSINPDDAKAIKRIREMVAQYAKTDNEPLIKQEGKARGTNKKFCVLTEKGVMVARQWYENQDQATLLLLNEVKNKFYQDQEEKRAQFQRDKSQTKDA